MELQGPLGDAVGLCWMQQGSQLPWFAFPVPLTTCCLHSRAAPELGQLPMGAAGGEKFICKTCQLNWANSRVFPLSKIKEERTETCTLTSEP